MASIQQLPAAGVEQLRAIFPEISTARATELLEACSGRVEHAVGLHLSQPNSSSGSGVAAATGSRSSAAATVATAAEEDVVMLGDKPRPSGSSTVRKRVAASPAASPSKRGKKEPTKEAGQHSLTAFFKATGAGSLAAAAAGATEAADSSPNTATGKLAAAARSKLALQVSSATAAAAASHAAAAISSPIPAAASSPSTSVPSPSPAPSLLRLSSLAGSSAGTADDTNPLRPCWRPGEPVPFVFLSRIFDLIEHENGRIKITNWLCFAFWQILAFTPADLPAALFLSSDQLAPAHMNHQLGVGGATLVSLVCELASVPRATIYADHQRLGDLGLIAAQYRQTQRTLFKPKPLTVKGVFSTMHSLADVSKKEKKEDLLKKLFVSAREQELVYLIRIAEGGLRIGAVVTTVLSALAKAFVLHQLYCENVDEARRHEACSYDRVLKASESVKAVKAADVQRFVLEPPPPADATPAAVAASIARRLPSYLAHATAKIRRAYAELPSFHEIIPVLLSSPTAIYELHKYIQLTAGVPVKPQLGRPLSSIAALLKLFRGRPFSAEVKYDGLRAQIHRLPSGAYRIFSRHLMSQGDRWSDLEPCMEAAIRHPQRTQSFILDAEIVAVEHKQKGEAADVQNGEVVPAFRILPFQQLSTRKRKGDPAAAAAAASAPTGSPPPKRVEVSCMVYAFDFLCLNGESLLLRSLPERRALMAATFAEQPGQLQFVEHVDIPAALTTDIALEELEEEEAQESSRKTRAAAGTKGKAAGAGAAADAAEEEANESDDDVAIIEDELEVSVPTSADAALADGGAAAAAGATGPEAEPTVQSPPVSAVASAEVGGAAAAGAAAPPPAGASATDILTQFLRTTALPRGEGIMAKSLSSRSTYEPDVRTSEWAKLKKDALNNGMGVADSIDVAIIGAWWGNGRKAGWMSPFLAAVYNAETGEFESFCKLMSGFTDEVYKRLTAECLEHVIPTPPKNYRVSPALTPVMWFRPSKVWEIRGADLTISPVHAAARGLVHESRGISLRFPRFIHERPDKSVEQCTTNEEVAHMYRGQAATMLPTMGKRGAR